MTVVAAALTWQFLLRPSGSLDDFEQWLVDDTRSPTQGSVKVTAMGTTMMLVDDGTTQVLIDPFITEVNLRQAAFNCPLTTDRVAVAAALDRVGATRVKAIFVSHSHFDHALDLAYVANRTGAMVYGSESTLNIARGGGVPEERLRLLDEKEEVPVGDFRVRTLCSRHSPTCFGHGDINEPLSQSTARFRDYKLWSRSWPPGLSSWATPARPGPRIAARAGSAPEPT